jgi:hypothetical protein
MGTKRKILDNKFTRYFAVHQANVAFVEIEIEIDKHKSGSPLIGFKHLECSRQIIDRCNIIATQRMTGVEMQLEILSICHSSKQQKRQ